MNKDLNSANMKNNIPRTPWVYDGEPLESREAETEETPTYKTPPAVLKAVRKYEQEIKKDKKRLERRNHQKNYSGAKAFITYTATIAELKHMKILIDQVLDWSKDIDNFDEMKRPERKERYKTR